MTRELSSAAVEARLVALRALHVPQGLDDAQAQLALDRPRRNASFAEVAARSLAELRSLCELTRYLHQARRRPR